MNDVDTVHVVSLLTLECGIVVEEVVAIVGAVVEHSQSDRGSGVLNFRQGIQVRRILEIPLVREFIISDVRGECASRLGEQIDLIVVTPRDRIPDDPGSVSPTKCLHKSGPKLGE